jgi:cytidine deaminase
MPVIRGLAVSTDIDPPASPCGMCRQFIAEFCEPEMKIWMYGKKAEEAKAEGNEREEGNGKVVVRTIGELLPMSFGKRDLVSAYLGREFVRFFFAS